MDIIPKAAEKCDLCSNRTADGERPFCAQIYPTQALMLYNDEKILGALRGDDRFHICKING